MPTPITFTLTNAGLNAALNADTTGLTLSLTRIAIGGGKYTPAATRTALQSEFSRYALSGGDVEPNSKTLRFSAVLESPITRQVFEIGLFTSTGVLFAVASTTGANPLILVTANISYVASFGMVLSEIPAGSVTVVTDPNAPLATTLIAQHVASANPHPQYPQYSNFVDIINALQTRINRLLPKVGDIKTTATAMTAAAFTAAQNDGSVWEVYGAGRTIVGAGTVTIDYSAATGEAARANQTFGYAAGQTGGEVTHKQISTELSQHKHSQGIHRFFTTFISEVGAQNGFTSIPPMPVLKTYNSEPLFHLHVGDISSSQAAAMAESSIGLSQPFNVMQPYIVACQFVCVTAAMPIPAIVFP